MDIEHAKKLPKTETKKHFLKCKDGSNFKLCSRECLEGRLLSNCIVMVKQVDGKGLGCAERVKKGVAVLIHNVFIDKHYNFL